MLLKVIVSDQTGNPVYCRVSLYQLPDSAPVDTSCCFGEHIFAVPQGPYRVEARRGKLYRPATCNVHPGEGSALAELRLERIIDPKKMGLYSFDAHSHVSRDSGSASGNLAMAALIMNCEDFNFFFAGSPYDAEVHFQYLQRNFTDQGTYRDKYARVIGEAGEPDFILDIGNEIVKGRYGHAFLMNYDQRVPFSRYYDEAFDHWIWNKSLDMPRYDIAYPYEAILRERGGNSVAVAAHPTSWWWHEDKEFIANIAATIGFDVLAGTIDAIVIMGYDNDKPFYQALWYDLLNNGYFLPGVAETDTAFDCLPGDFLRFKTYAWLEEFSIDALCRAVRMGRCIVSSGPLILLQVDGELPGNMLTFLPGQQFTAKVLCVACCDGPISSVQIIVNGEIEARYAAQGDRFTVEHKLTVNANSYVLAKCYDTAGNVAIANPVYIRNEPFVNDNYMAGIRVEAVADAMPASGWYWLEGGFRQSFDGSFHIRMNPAAELHVMAAGQEKTVRLFELPELQDIFRRLYLGQFQSGGNFSPGEVAAEEYQIRRIRELLDNVRLQLDFTNKELREEPS